jgi:hypothetical protein
MSREIAPQNPPEVFHYDDELDGEGSPITASTAAASTLRTAASFALGAATGATRASRLSRPPEPPEQKEGRDETVVDRCVPACCLGQR